MSIVIIDNGSHYTTALLKFFHNQATTVINYESLDYKNISKNDTVILTGGHSEPILWHKKQYAKEVQLVKRHKGPIIGICLGFELIAHVYGSHLHLLNSRRKGEVRLTIVGKSGLAIPASIDVYENHNWSVISLRRPLKAIARSKDGVEIFKHSRRPIYGLQFHPEESSTGGMAVLASIINEIG